jgi:hypothetical protein
MTARACKNGKKFEDSTDFAKHLVEVLGFTKTMHTKKGFSIDFSLGDTKITYVSSHGFARYMTAEFDCEMFRKPDEAYIIKPLSDLSDKSLNGSPKVHIKILEKKEQKTRGSAETKLWACPSLKQEYEIILGNDFIVHYGLCVGKFYKQNANLKRYQILNEIIRKNDIGVLYGCEDDYIDQLKNWILHCERL